MLELAPGDEVMFDTIEGNRIVVEKKPTYSPFDKYVGYLSKKQGEDPDVLVARLRGEEAYGG